MCQCLINAFLCPHGQGGGGLGHCGHGGRGGQFFAILCGRLLWTAPNPNHDQFSVGCDDHEACCRYTQQTLMELNGFWFSIMQFQQFSNYLLCIGGPRVKQIIITPTKKSSKFCKVSKTVMSSRHIKKTDQLCIKQLQSKKSPKFSEATSWHKTIDLANFNFSPNQTRKMFDAKP